MWQIETANFFQDCMTVYWKVVLRYRKYWQLPISYHSQTNGMNLLIQQAMNTTKESRKVKISQLEKFPFVSLIPVENFVLVIWEKNFFEIHDFKKNSFTAQNSLRQLVIQLLELQTLLYQQNDETAFMIGESSDKKMGAEKQQEKELSFNVILLLEPTDGFTVLRTEKLCPRICLTSCLLFSEDEITSESEIEEDDQREEDNKTEENMKTRKRKRQLRLNEVPELLAKRHKAFKPYRYTISNFYSGAQND